MRLPRRDSNQNSSAGSQSMAAARAVLKLDSADQRPVARSTRPTSCGLTALDQMAVITGAAALPPTAMREYVPDASEPTSAGVPPSSGTSNSRSCPARSARK